MRQIYSHDLLIITFSLGCLPLMFMSKLLSDIIWYATAFGVMIIVIASKFLFRKTLLLISIFMLSFLWSTAYSKQYLINIDPYIDKTLVVKAKVESINIRHPSQQINPYYLQWTILESNHQASSTPIPISIYWDNVNVPKIGQIWQLTIKTKVVHSYLNEGGFDSQLFAIANRTLLSAKIINAKLLKDKNDIRQTIVDHALPYMYLFHYRGILFALAFGDRSQLDHHYRQIMMNTGVAHLMAISGMHILLVFGICYSLVKLMLFFIPQRFNNLYVPIIIGWLCACFYAWLTGFNPPALRAIMALGIWIYLRCQNQHISAWQKINRIIALLLLTDPLMILSESFWLSCYAVVSLIFLYQWVPLSKKIQNNKKCYLVKLIHLQLGLTALLLPIQLFVFQGVSTMALLANLIAIPIISLLTFPSILIALCFSFFDCFYLALWFWFIAEQSLDYLFYCLKRIDFPWFTTSSDFYLLSIIGWLAIITLKTGFWRRHTLTLCILLMIIVSPFFKKQHYLWRMDMLDVGHGLAIVIHDGKSAILYDTGAQWQNSSAAERIIIPFLQWHNLDVKGIIISHQHNDHIGGLSLLQQHYPNAWLMSSSVKLKNHYHCLSENHLTWNNLSLTVLWPTHLAEYAQNEDSCVIHITDGQFSVLLSGDLEKNQEYQLIEKHRNTLKSTILQIPHHGSNTSSSYAFLNAVNPSVSLLSTSRYNPWKLPSNKVIARYKDRQLNFYTTSKSGQISLVFYHHKWELKTMRNEINPRWYHNWFGH